MATANPPLVDYLPVGTGLRSIQDIIADLSKPINPKHIKDKQQGGTKLKFIPWYFAVKYLDRYAPGWSYDIEIGPVMQAPIKQPNDKKTPRGKVFVKATISIPCSEGVVHRSATGMEDDVVTGYGDPSSNAESMALRRAAAKFGLGISLYYEKK
jgi:hypothetical protein